MWNINSNNEKHHKLLDLDTGLPKELMSNFNKPLEENIAYNEQCLKAINGSKWQELRNLIDGNNELLKTIQIHKDNPRMINLWKVLVLLQKSNC